MAEMPDKIYAGSKAAVGVPNTGDWHPVETPSTPTPYIRADLVDDAVKALEEARESLEIFADCVSDHTQIRQDISDDLAKIDAALTRIKGKKEI